MAYSYVVYTGNGSTTQFAITFPYIRKEHVKVYVNYVDTAYTYVNDTTVQLATAPAFPLRVEVRRVTPLNTRLVDYTDGSTLVAADLDTSNLQSLYNEQELDDSLKQTVSIDPATGLPSAGGQRITNVANPVNAQDAATKTYVDAVTLAGNVPDGDRGDITVSGVGTSWTIDANAVTSAKILDGTILDADVNATAGIVASKLSFTQAGASAVARTVDSKLKDTVSVKDFGAVGDGATNDTAAINAALAASSNLLFPPGTYAVTTITFDGIGRQLTFNGASILGIATASTPAVIQITGREMLITGLIVNCNFKTNYTAAIKWHSLSAGAPAQFIRIYDLKIYYAKIGILFGQLSGTAVIDAAQSENDVFGYTTRGVEQCVYINQSNGFITFHGGTIWSSLNEWVTGFTTTNARVVNAVQGSVLFIGCELLLTQFQDGRGIDVAGGGVAIQSCTIEIANSFFLNTGSLSINSSGGYFAPGGTPCFDLTAGNLSVNKYGAARSPIAVGDNGFLIKTPGTGVYNGKILIENSTFENWNNTKIFTYNSAENLAFGTYIKLKNLRVGAVSTGYTEIEDTTRNDLDRFNLDNGVTALANNWFIFNDYGGGTTLTLSATVPSAEFSNSVQLYATGAANICTTDAASSLTRTIKQGTSNLYFVSARIYRAAGAGSTKIGVRNFSTAGASTGVLQISANTPTTTWTTVSAIISTAGPLVAFNLSQEVGTVSVCDVSMVKIGVFRL